MRSVPGSLHSFSTSSDDHRPMKTIKGRTPLRAGLALVVAPAIGACSRQQDDQSFINPDAEQIDATEERRRPGRVRDFTIEAVAGTVDIGGPTVSTWSYGERLPGEPIRVNAREQVRARLVNRLSRETSVNWHGLALRNDADGVPGITLAPIEPDTEFVHQFTALHPATFWFHPHTGTQLGRGLYPPLIVEEPREPLGYDDEWVIVLDDWLDGVTGDPDEVFAELAEGMGSMDHGSMDMKMELRKRAHRPWAVTCSSH